MSQIKPTLQNSVMMQAFTKERTLVIDHQALESLTTPAFLTKFMFECDLSHLLIKNVPGNIDFSELKSWPNLSGILLAPTECKHITRGLEAIQEGRSWFPRAVTDHWMRHYLNTQQHQSTQIAQLTDKELKVLKLLSAGISLAHMAEKMFISDATVRVHLHKIYQKIGVKNKQQAVLWAKQNLTKTAVEPSES